MYDNCIYKVKHKGTLSESIISSTGVKQGCNISPVLSNIYQYDLHDIFDDKCNPVSLKGRKINSLSWADDLLLFSTSKQGLQNCLSKLDGYCFKWGLVVNEKKTMTMTCSIGNVKQEYLEFRGVTLDVVNKFKYLGMIIHRNGKTKASIEDRCEKSRRAMYLIRKALATTGNVSVKLALSLFDKVISPILLYGCMRTFE